MGERREIALMEQLMKVVLRAVRAVTYSRLEGRVLAPQLGWLQGCSTAHVGVQLLVLIQQAARLGHTLYICYVDLATFFSRVLPSRDANYVAEFVRFCEYSGGSETDATARAKNQEDAALRG